MLNDKLKEYAGNMGLIVANHNQSLKIDNDNSLSHQEKSYYNMNPEDFEQQEQQTRIPMDRLAQSQSLSNIAANLVYTNTITKNYEELNGNNLYTPIPLYAPKQYIENINTSLEQKQKEKEKAIRQEEINKAWWGKRLLSHFKYDTTQNNYARAYSKYVKAVIASDLQEQRKQEAELKRLSTELEGLVEPTQEDTVSNISQLLASDPKGMLMNLGVTAGQTAATYYSGGVGAVPAAAVGGAARFAITFNGAKDLELGSTLLEMKNNGWEEKEAFELADKISDLNASIEAGFDAVLAGAGGLASRTIIKLGTKNLIKKLTLKGLTKEAVNLALDASGESFQELWQNSIQEELMNNKDKMDENTFKIFEETLAKTGKLAIETGQSIIKNKKLTPEQEQAWKTVKQVWGPSFIVGGTMQTAVRGVEKAIDKVNPVEEDVQMSLIKDYVKQSEQMSTMINQGSESLQKAEDYLEYKKNSTLLKEDPNAFNALRDNAIETGEQPAEVFIDNEVVAKLVETANTSGDANLQAKINKLELNAKLEESNAQGGKPIAVDFGLADETIFDPTNDTLFQEVKDGISFDESTVSKAVSNKVIAEEALKTPNLEERLQDEKSLASKMYTELTKTQAPERAIANIALVQNLLNTMTSVSKTPITEEQLLKKYNLNIENLTEATGEGLQQNIDKQQKEEYIEYKEDEENEFRRLQEESERLSDEEKQLYRSSSRQIDENLRERFSNVFKRRLEAFSSSHRYDARILRDTKTQNEFKIYGNVDGSTFRDIFSMVRNYLPNGELVDVHSLESDEYSTGYNDTENYLSEDGMSGFSITKSGDLISVFNIGLKRGWLRAIEPIIKSKAKTLDCYVSPKQDLQGMYSKIFGFQTASIMDYNMDYDHDDIAKNHDKPQVAFMVNTDKKIETKHFDKDSYDDAVAYQQEIAKESSLYQTTGTTIAGEFDPKAMVIRLTKAQNPATFVHEFSHFTLHVLVNEFNEGNINSAWAKEMDKLAKWGGIEIVDGKLSFKDNEQYREFQEKFAESFVDYLQTGKAPVQRLEGIFAAMKNWLLEVYNLIAHRKLNKTITQFFDRLLMTDAEVVDQMTMERLGNLTKPDNFTDEAYDEYKFMLEKSRGNKSSQMIEAQEALAKKRTTQAYKDKLKELKEQAVAELEQDESYEIRSKIADVRIHKASIPEGLKLKPMFVSINEGVDAQIMATKYGFNNVVEFVEFLNESRSLNDDATELANSRAEEWLAQEYPELVNISGNISLSDIASIKAQVYESMILNNIPSNQFNMIYNELINTAEKTIIGSPLIKMLRIDNFQKMLQNVAMEYRIAELKGDKKSMAKLRYRMASLNYYIFRAGEIKKSVSKFSRHFRKYKKRPTDSQLKGIDGKAWDIITAIMNRFGFTGKRPAVSDSVTKRIMDYTKELLNKGFEFTSLLENNAYFLNNPENIRNRQISVSEFENIDASMRDLERIGKKSKYATVEGKRVEINKDVDSIVAFYKKHNTKQWNKKDVAKNVLLRSLAPKEIVLNKFWPKSVNIKYVQPFMNALVKQTKWARENGERIIKIIEPVLKKEKKVFTIDGRKYTYMELFVSMLNSGNSHNKACMIKTLEQKFGEYTEADFVSMLNQAPKELRKYAQQMWDFFESNVTEFMDVTERVNGKVLKKVEAEPVMFDDGTVLSGGYYPCGKVASEPISFTDEGAFKPDGVFPTFFFQKDRELSVHGDLDLTLDTLESWLYKMSAVINVMEPFTNLSNLIYNERLRRLSGEGFTLAMREWLQYAIMPEKVNKALSVLDRITAAGVLGGNPAKALVQISGLIPATYEIGAQYVLPEMLLFAGNPLAMIAAPWKAMKLSDYMKERFSNPENHIVDIRKTPLLRTSSLTGKFISKTGKRANDAWMYPVVCGDAIASYISWKAQYRKSKAEGLSHEEAVLEADSVVRRFQGDTTAGSRPPITQGNMRFFSKFSSYFLAMSAQVYSIAFGRKYGGVKAIMWLAVVGCLAPMFEAAMSSWYDWNFDDEEEKRKLRKQGIKTLEQLFEKKFKENTVTSTSSTIAPVFGIGSHIGRKIMGLRTFEPTVNALTTLQNTANVVFDIRDVTDTKGKSRRQIDKEKENLYKDMFSIIGWDWGKMKENKRIVEDLLRNIK